jgi:hypothetical protein
MALLNCRLLQPDMAVASRVPAKPYGHKKTFLQMKNSCLRAAVIEVDSLD